MEHYYPYKRSGISLKYINDSKQLMRWRDDSGTRQKYLYCSWEDAVKVVESILIREGRITAADVSFDALAKEYLTQTANMSSYPSIQKQVKQLLKEFSGKGLSSFGTLDVERLQNKLLGAGNAPGTVNHKTAILKAMFAAAVRWKMVSREVLFDVRAAKQLKVDNARVRYLSDDEAERLLARLMISRNAELRYQVQIAMHTGMRLMEVVNLVWGRIDMENRLILVDNTKSKRNRHIPINDTCLEVLKEYRKRAKVIHLDGRLFSGFGRRAWNCAIKDAGIQDFRFHDLRHSFASWLMQRGAQLAAIQCLLGHSKITMTLRYAHLEKTAARDSVRLLDGRVGNG